GGSAARGGCTGRARREGAFALWEKVRPRAPCGALRGALTPALSHRERTWYVAPGREGGRATRFGGERDRASRRERQRGRPGAVLRDQGGLLARDRARPGGAPLPGQLVDLTVQQQRARLVPVAQRRVLLVRDQTELVVALELPQRGQRRPQLALRVAVAGQRRRRPVGRPRAVGAEGASAQPQRRPQE